MSLIKCSECGKEISDRASSCPGCGCPVAVVETIKCIECGYPMPIGSERCPNCGCPVSNHNTIEEDILEDVFNRYGVSSVVLGIIGMIAAFTINSGILLVIPLIMFIISILCDKKEDSKIGDFGVVISITGCALVGFEIIKSVLFFIM